jgi:hypothetical protein
MPNVKFLFPDLCAKTTSSKPCFQGLMRNLWVFGAYMAMCTIAAHANSYSANQSLPACAVSELPIPHFSDTEQDEAQCIVEQSFIPSNATTNYTHICMSKVLSNRLGHCISAHCTIKESLS